jgi:hypothetical protein
LDKNKEYIIIDAVLSVVYTKNNVIRIFSFQLVYKRSFFAEANSLKKDYFILNITEEKDFFVLMWLKKFFPHTIIDINS